MTSHRAPDRDRVGTALAAVWAAGHLAAAVLLGFTVHVQQELHDQAAPVPHSVPDHEPPPA